MGQRRDRLNQRLEDQAKMRTKNAVRKKKERKRRAERMQEKQKRMEEKGLGQRAAQG